MALRLPDLSHVLVADLPRGWLASHTDTRLVALPAAWLDTVAERHAGAADDLAATLAPLVAADADAVLSEVDDPSPDDVGYALSVAFAARGLGLAAFERWGDALLCVWKDPPGSSAAFRAMGASLVARTVSILTGLEVHGAAVFPAGDPTDALHILLGNTETCTMARDLGREGQTLGTVLDRLKHGASA